MWKNYFKIALRNLRKQRAFSIVNIMGLSLGMAACSVPVAGWLMTRWAPRQIIRIGLGSLIFVLAIACVLSIGGTTASWLMLGAAGCIAATTGCVVATLQALETTSVPNEVRQSAISAANCRYSHGNRGSLLVALRL